jgi:hypothetical protein
MSQHVINCPVCNKQHEVEGFRSGGEVKALVSVGREDCTLFEENPAKIVKLLGLSYVHEQRVRNMEMPRTDECELEEY